MTSIIAALVRLYQHIPMCLITLLARILVGLVFFRSGLTKIDGLSIKPATFFLFENEYKIRILKYLGLSDVDYSMPMPDLAAYLGTAVELSMPFFLWLGLGARFAATVLLGMTAVIESVYPNSYMEHGFWAVALLLIMARGAGVLSVDYLIKRQHMDRF
ncbi:MAG: DoxX family protein [Hyphomicrobiaceae bacterium]